MTDEPITETPEEEVLPSILSELRQARASIGSGATPIEITIPGYDDKLVIRFKWVPFRELRRSAQALAKITEPTVQAVAAAADALVATCDEVLVRLGEGEEVKPLSTNGTPVTFSDPRLAYALGFEASTTARDQAIRTFNNEYALIDVSNRVLFWLSDTSKKVDQETLGES